MKTGRQRIFRNKEARDSYFAAHLSKTFNELSYQRLGQGFKIEATVDSVNNCNYVSFINRTSGVEGEIFAEITNKEYINNNTISITYQVNWWITLMFDIKVNPGIVEREHLSQNDWILANANPYTSNIHQLLTPEDALPFDESMENLGSVDTPDGVVFPEVSQIAEESKNVLMCVLGQTNLTNISFDSRSLVEEVTVGTWKGAGGTYWGVGISSSGTISVKPMLQNIPSICSVFFMPYDTDTQISEWKWFFDCMAANDLVGNIMGLYYVPLYYAKNLEVNIDSPILPDDGLTFNIDHTKDTYAPRNPKLKRYPYHFVRVYSNNGQEKDYAYENFIENSYGSYTQNKFRAMFTLNGEPTVMLCPYLYKNTESGLAASWVNNLNFNEAITFSDIPHIPYATDGYVTYLSNKARQTYAQNANIRDFITSPVKGMIAGSIAGSKFGGPYGALGGLVAGGLVPLVSKAFKAQAAGAAVRGHSALLDNDASMSDRFIEGFALGEPFDMRSMMPADNINRGSENGFNTYFKAPLRFTIRFIQPKASISEVYDTYLDYFGYASGEVKVPNAINYVKDETNLDLLPHFAHIGIDNVTYAKATITVEPTGKAPYEAASQIEEMFRAGVLFVTNEEITYASETTEVSNETEIL